MQAGCEWDSYILGGKANQLPCVQWANSREANYKEKFHALFQDMQTRLDQERSKTGFRVIKAAFYGTFFLFVGVVYVIGICALRGRIMPLQNAICALFVSVSLNSLFGMMYRDRLRKDIPIRENIQIDARRKWDEEREKARDAVWEKNMLELSQCRDRCLHLRSSQEGQEVIRIIKAALYNIRIAQEKAGRDPMITNTEHVHNAINIWQS